MDHTARCRSLDQHGIEGHAIEPPTGLLRMKQELVARKSRVSPCRHSTIGSGVPSREEGIVYAEMAKRGFDRRRRHFSDARPAGYGGIDKADSELRREKLLSESAVAQPAGPAPAIRTSKFTAALCSRWPAVHAVHTA
jgi:hypothetical protein